MNPPKHLSEIASPTVMDMIGMLGLFVLGIAVAVAIILALV